VQPESDSQESQWHDLNQPMNGKEQPMHDQIHQMNGKEWPGNLLA
jgi:hypothetical protein